jgi:hypothetical protein
MLARNEVIERALRMDSHDRAVLAEMLLASLDQQGEVETRRLRRQVAQRDGKWADPLAELWDNPRDAAYDKL